MSEIRRTNCGIRQRPSNRRKCSRGCAKKLNLSTILLISLQLALFATLARGHQRSTSTDVKCSYVPPSPDQVTHVWLDDPNNSASLSSFEFEDFSNQATRKDLHPPKVAKRHAISRREYASGPIEGPSSHQSSWWNFLNRLGYPEKEVFIPIKIHAHYDSSVHMLEKSKFDLITEIVMPSVIKFFESVLSLRREYTIDRFRISRRCPDNIVYHPEDRNGPSRPYCMDRCENYAICGELTVPQEHLSACSYCNSTSKRCLTDFSTEGEGVANAQMVLYVSAKQTSRCNKDQTIAYAAHCAQDAKTDRPVAGHANLCPSSISTDPKDLKALISTVKHELTHVLGFSVSLFAYYRDKHGFPLTERKVPSRPIHVDPKTGYAKWSDKIIKKFVRNDWVTGEGKMNKVAHLIVTPTVTREARLHFNCSSLEGAELEDQGSDGTSMTHWEKRLFENEAMTGTHTQNSVYSRLTLAVLQDTGWYVANFSRAEKLEWGKDLGCDFAKKSCKSWIDERRAQGKSISPFCDRIKGDTLQITCTEDRTSKAVCNMKQYKEPLPLVYKNFDYLDGIDDESLVFYGGSVDLADYCPFIQEFTWQSQNVTIRGSRCDIGGNSLESDRNAALEFYGPQTKCFEHAGKWEQRSCIYKRHWHHYGAGCYKYTCSNGYVSVVVGNHSYACYYPDQELHIQQLNDRWLYHGVIICPPCEKICPSHKCKTFDKRIVDKIMKIHEEKLVSNEPHKNVDIVDEERLRPLFDEVVNSLNLESDEFENGKINSIATGSNSSAELLLLKKRRQLKESLFQVFSNRRIPPKASLMCSSANTMSAIVSTLWVSILFTSNITLLLRSFI